MVWTLVKVTASNKGAPGSECRNIPWVVVSLYSPHSRPRKRKYCDNHAPICAIIPLRSSANFCEMTTTMYGPAGPKDVHEPGKATCPKCSLRRGYGTSGVINLVKTHLDKVGCTVAQAKKDQQPRKNGPLSAFFKEKTTPIAKLLKPTVKAPSPMRQTAAPATHPSIAAAASVAPSSVTQTRNSRYPSSRASQLLDQFHTSVELLPSTLPRANQDNSLSEFAGQPTEYVSHRTPAVVCDRGQKRSRRWCGDAECAE
ncbi:hypothetical protein B0H14DRAFT_2613115 [Mycena olivaceomarginata]|nr:hypothetical protein B0H14DRAFT_2613115 [Mycena olivaceomarginata]